MPSPLPVHLITGLLGSGKTTCLKHLIQQKPPTENWIILINEFGEVDIDAAQLLASAPKDNTVEIHEVSGGCICCTAQLGLVNTLNQVFSGTDTKIDRVFIEPTGLGHPAKIIDSLQNTPFSRPLSLQKVACVITPQQLTPERWQKSAVMRDLVTLADTIILNKIDVDDSSNQQQAKQLLEDCFPPKDEVVATKYANVNLSTLLQKRQNQPFTILSTKSLHLAEANHRQETYPSKIEQIQRCFIRVDNTNANLLSMGWIWSSKVQFNRIKLKTFFEQIAPSLIRAKGIIKTGKEWQLVNWSEGQIQFEDIAWRQDSRLECLFDSTSENPTRITSLELEKMLQNTIHSYNS
ncbi:MAG: GTP-binding protein [Pseudomonadota bacterium]|nr:GTP-binding protein [Pseudomonadota bacterium]